MGNTAGFYKQDSGDLLWAPNFVTGPGFTLDGTNPADQGRAVDGWAWFGSEEEAQAAYPQPAPDPAPPAA